MTTQPDSETNEDTGPAGLREALKRAEAENAELVAQANVQRTRTMEAAFTALGLDPSKGIGKAVLKTYEGEPSLDEVKAFAEAEFDWKSSTDPAAALVDDAQSRVDAVTNTAAPVVAGRDQLQTAIAAAEEAGDLAETMRLKASMLTG